MVSFSQLQHLLRRLPVTQVYRNRSRFPEAEPVPGILCIRIDAQFYFGNVEYLKRLLCHPEQLQAEPVHTVIIDASAINQIDSSAEGALRDIVATLREKGIRFCLAGVKGPVRDVLQRSSFAEVLGEDCLYLTLHEAVSAADRSAA